MKNKKGLILVFVATTLASTSLFSCDNSTMSVEKVIATAETMSRNELYKKAMDELDGKTMYALGNSSRMKTAIDYFLNYLRGYRYSSLTKSYVEDSSIKAEFSYVNNDFDGKIQYTQPVNNKIFSFISSDVRSTSHSLSMTLIQDGNQIQSKMLDTGYLLNYIPKEWEGDKSLNGEPFALQSLSKVFVYNNQGTKKFNNVWCFVADGFSTQFMSPNSEPVGKNFLYMLTKDEYVSCVKEAYEAYDGDKTSLNKTIQECQSLTGKFGLTDDAKYALAWIKLFVKQYQIENDDAPICENLTNKNNADAAGLLVYSKFRLIDESSTNSNKFVNIAAYDDDYVGFGGYMYKHYLQILKTCPYPWTSCALINFISTTSYGFSPWGKDIGGYCSNPSSNQSHGNDGGEEFPIKNDRGYAWWTDNTKGKGRLVVEDPLYASKTSYTLGSWIDSL